MSKPCHFNDEKSLVTCEPMGTQIAASGTVGLHRLTVINGMAAAAESPRVRCAGVYFGKRNGRKASDMLMLNWCPWCGEPVRDGVKSLRPLVEPAEAAP